MQTGYLTVDQPEDDAVSRCSASGEWENNDSPVSWENQSNEEDCDISPEHSEMASVVSEGIDSTEGSYDSDYDSDDDDVPEQSPLDMVFSIILDEQLQNDAPTGTETVDPWHAMNSLRATEDTHDAIFASADDGHEDEDDLYSIYVLAAEGDLDDQDSVNSKQQHHRDGNNNANTRLGQVEQQETEEWKELGDVAKMALHHHSPYASLAGNGNGSMISNANNKNTRNSRYSQNVSGGNTQENTPMSSVDTRDWEQIQADMQHEDVTKRRGVLQPEKPPVEPPVRRAPQRLTLRRPPPRGEASTTTVTSTDASSSSSSSSSTQPSSIGVPNPGVGVMSLLKGKIQRTRKFSADIQAEEILGMRADETEAARKKRDEMVARQLQAAKDRERIFHEVMKNLKVDKFDLTQTPPHEKRDKSNTPPPMLRRMSSLRRSDGSGAILKGEKVKLMPLAPATSRSSGSEGSIEQ